MAERYQVRGRRIWDSHWDMYTALFDTEELAEQMIRRADSYQFKPLAEWKDDKPQDDPVDKPRYEVRGRRIWDSETDTYSKLFGDKQEAEVIMEFVESEQSSLLFKPLAEWQDEKPVSDPVNHPSHYQGKVECIDAIEAALGDDGFVACCRGNAMKYIYRAGRKGDSVEDLRKAAWYLDRAIKTLEK